MKCCVLCFRSAEINYLINTSGQSDNCDTCGARGVSCVDSRELFFKFNPLFELYLAGANGLPIADRFLTDFPQSIFAIDDKAQITRLLASIVSDDAETYAHYFEENLILSCAEDDAYREEMSTLVSSWEQFSEEIKSINRFHIATSLDLEKLGKLLTAINVRLPRGRRFFRARLSGKDGYTREEMGNPPSHLASAGRANPIGISYLYVAGDLETTIYETRAGLYDYVSVAEFRLIDDIVIVDLKDVENYDPFTIAESELLETYMAFRPFLLRLGEELSKPKRPDDSELDYIPTQYLAEFIKSRDYSGIGYGSAQNAAGHNYAMFHPSKFECVGVTVHEIGGIQFNHHPLE